MTVLHVGNTAASWVTWNPWVVSFGVLFFLAAATWIWTPSSRQVFRRRWIRRASLHLAALAAAVAITPAILPYDHLFPAKDHSTQQHVQAHELHCHGSPASCSDAPMTSGAGQFLSTEPLLLQPALVLVLLLLATPVLVGLSLRPAVRPPLFAASI